MLSFEWNPAKARLNRSKHGIAFEEARSVFYDEHAMQFYDGDALEEDRYVLLGMSDQFRVLIVVHCERGIEKEIIRIMSARKATKREMTFYVGANSKGDRE